MRRRDAAGLDPGRQAPAAQLAPGLAFGPARSEARVVRDLEQLVERRRRVAAVVLDRDRRLVRIGLGRDEVAPANLDRVDPHLARRLVDDALELERRLRAPGAAIGVDRHRVGEDRAHVHVDERRQVGPRHQRAVQPGRDRRREGRQIRAHVRQRVGAHGEELAVLVQRQLDLRHVVARMRVRHEGLGAGRGPLDRTADLLGGPGDEGLLGVVVDLGPEAAADVRRHDAQLVLGNAEHEGAHQQADDVRVLRRREERVLVVGVVELADRAARLDRVRDQAVVGQLQRRDVVRAADRLIDGLLVLLDEAPVEAEVRRQLVMDLGRPVRERCAHVDDGGQVLDVEHDRLGGAAGLLERLRDDGRDRVADMPDAAMGQDRVPRLLHDLAEAVGHLPAAGDAADVLEVLAGEDADHARHSLRGARVDAPDRSVRDVRAQEMHVRLSGPVDVVGVPALAGQEPNVLASPGAGADAAIHSHCWVSLIVAAALARPCRSFCGTPLAATRRPPALRTCRRLRPGSP